MMRPVHSYPKCLREVPLNRMCNKGAQTPLAVHIYYDTWKYDSHTLRLAKILIFISIENFALDTCNNIALAKLKHLQRV